MKRKQVILAIGIITIVIALLSYCELSSYFVESKITVVDVRQSDKRNVMCYLQWQGRDSTTLELTSLADLGRTNNKYTLEVNNNEVFTVPIVANYSWVEIIYCGKTVSLHSDGINATLTNVGNA